MFYFLLCLLVQHATLWDVLIWMIRKRVPLDTFQVCLNYKTNRQFYFIPCVKLHSLIRNVIHIITFIKI